MTTTRLTHATPAAGYAYSGKRGWESDADQTSDVPNPEDREKCPDIAYQLVHGDRNQDFRVGYYWLFGILFGRYRTYLTWLWKLELVI